MTFSAKKRFSDEGDLTTVKRRVDPHASLDDWVDHLLGGIRDGKSEQKTTSDKEVDLLLRLPPPIVRVLMGLVHLADALGLLPASMIESDPMYSSVFVANLGSVGLDAGYHHLWEHGTCPVFCVIGRIHEGPDGRRRTLLKLELRRAHRGRPLLRRRAGADSRADREPTEAGLAEPARSLTQDGVRRPGRRDAALARRATEP